MIVATMLWDANAKSASFSRYYDEGWVEKLYRGFRRNLTLPFRFVCFTDRPRSFAEPIDQEPINTDPPTWAAYVEPYRLNVPMILVGLDTVVVGNVDHLARYCQTETLIALPRDPYHKATVCNGVALVPAGQRGVFDRWQGENDMEWMRRQPHAVIDDLFPGEVVSFKGHVNKRGLGNARIVYMHGVPKPHALGHLAWVREHWV